MRCDRRPRLRSESYRWRSSRAEDAVARPAGAGGTSITTRSSGRKRTLLRRSHEPVRSRPWCQRRRTASPSSLWQRLPLGIGFAGWRLDPSSREVRPGRPPKTASAWVRFPASRGIRTIGSVRSGGSKWGRRMGRLGGRLRNTPPRSREGFFMGGGCRRPSRGLMLGGTFATRTGDVAGCDDRGSGSNPVT
jgi:hypothetical protein